MNGITHHLGIAQLVHPSIKQAEADQLRADVEHFVARGGTIEVLGNNPIRKEEKGSMRERANREKAYNIQMAKQAKKNAPAQAEDDE
ncbi:MAG: hypothetical protein Q4G62_07195 [Pseudomonadota bacterium]|nr:hypothetical protein [Pseudomonadota bacterium]